MLASKSNRCLNTLLSPLTSFGGCIAPRAFTCERALMHVLVYHELNETLVGFNQRLCSRYKEIVYSKTLDGLGNPNRGFVTMTSEYASDFYPLTVSNIHFQSKQTKYKQTNKQNKQTNKQTNKEFLYNT